MVLADGFSWNSKTCRNLSKVAFAIGAHGPDLCSKDLRRCTKPHRHDIKLMEC
jgi:hypothetical protein